MPQLTVMHTSGHNIYRWDPGDQASVAEAKQTLEGLMKKGYRAYEYSPIAQGQGKRIKDISEFDPFNMSEVVLSPPVAGG